jgi:dTDP-4-amino-4,6-dideoxygalactose transaminase
MGVASRAGTRTRASASPPPAAAAPSPATPAVIPFARLDNADPELLAQLLEDVRGVAESGAFTLSGHVSAFERDFAAYCETPFAVGVSSGTEALALSLRALEIGAGDEVIVPANSFIATAEAVSAVGATPRLVDVCPNSHLLTAEILEAALGPRVRCVIPVHLFGATVDLDPILELACAAGVHVVEDACQAHGARYRGRRVGTVGELGCFSFYPTKNLGGWGDGGAVVTASPRLKERLELLRSHGERPRYRHRVVGATARLDALQAAVLRRKLTRLEGWNDERRRLGAALRELLGSAGFSVGARPARGTGGTSQGGGSAFDLPALPFPDADHVYHLFVVRSAGRDLLREHLAARGVASAIHYPTPIHLTEAYAHLGHGPGSFPVCEALASRICSLPLFPGMSEGELRAVAQATLAFAEALPRNAR